MSLNLKGEIKNQCRGFPRLVDGFAKIMIKFVNILWLCLIFGRGFRPTRQVSKVDIEDEKGVGLQLPFSRLEVYKKDLSFNKSVL